MANPELVEQFVAITAAPHHVAEHVLEAHNWDVDAAVDFYLESGGVGHGNANFGAAEASPPRPAAAQGPLPASAAPRSSPIEILDDDEDVQILAENFNRRQTSQRRRHVEDMVDDDWQPGVEEMDLAGSSDEEGDAVKRQRQRQRLSNRPRSASGGPGGSSLPRRGRPSSSGGGGAQPTSDPQHADVDPAALPDDVDMEEQRMLMAALTGEAYQGRIPEFNNDPRYQARSLSPGAQEREFLRQEQDAAFHESLAADQEKERREREAREAEEAIAQAAQAAAREAEEAAAALERELDAKAAALPSEPPAGDENEVVLVVRLPAGGRLNRRFRKSDPLSAVFNWVDVSQRNEQDRIMPGKYNLVSQFPRRVFEDGTGGTSLAEADVAHKQEALFVVAKD